MNREERAKQFMPFDALKGLSDALRLKEYEVERISKGDLNEEKILEISKVLQDIKKTSIIKLKYFSNGHYLNYCGKVEIDIVKQTLKFDKTAINFNDIMDISIIE